MDEKVIKARTPIVPIILGSAVGVFVLILLGVFFVMKTLKSQAKEESSDDDDGITKVSMRALERECIIKDNQDLEEDVTGKRPPSFMYLGASAFDVKDDTLVKVSADSGYY